MLVAASPTHTGGVLTTGNLAEPLMPQKSSQSCGVKLVLKSPASKNPTRVLTT